MEENVNIKIEKKQWKKHTNFRVTPGEFGSPKGNFWELLEQEFLQGEGPPTATKQYSVIAEVSVIEAKFNLPGRS